MWATISLEHNDIIGKQLTKMDFCLLKRLITINKVRSETTNEVDQSKI